MVMASPPGAGAPPALLPFVMLFFLHLTVTSSPLPPDAQPHSSHISLAPSLSLSVLLSSQPPPPESPAPTPKSSPPLPSSSPPPSSPGSPVMPPTPPSAFSPEPAAADDLISGQDTTNGARGGRGRMSGGMKAGIAIGVLAAAAAAATLVVVCLKRRRNERRSAYTSTGLYEIF
ncbi:proline-rich receptor-like protein kinase PERK8 [Zingiber officinale]|uniref:proline-rich receptor-like protein kinase PERK8 n=1 Tax=Zingiber officinale TaxID=94328 RepID=UPI001C4B032D|nr:proline-rich receptor-like protein kinase PERK8 [Zingiber officinale]